jgi:N-acetylmuramoyl-L-alanine amidase
VQAEEKANGAVVRIAMENLPSAYEAAIGQDNTLYITIMPAAGNIRKLSSLPATDVYSSVLAIQNPNSVQLSFKLKQKYLSRQIFIDSTASAVVVALYSQADVKNIAVDEIKKKLEDEKKDWKLDIVVIDPGHGGEDPGAIGLKGTMEKNVTLAVAKDLKKAITERLPKVKVVMTRDDDEFVELDKRGEIANEAGGKLFISIHCNSMPHKPNSMNGLETYFLRPGRTDEAIRIAAQENAAVKYENDYEKKYEAYDEDNMILTTMAHSAYVKYSEQLAQLIEDNVSSIASVGNNGISQAGFYVLVGASMPAVLVETGYLSNPKEEKYLRSKNGQEAIARGVANAVVKYKDEYEKNFTQN